METTATINTYLLSLMRGVGAKTVSKLKTIGIHSVADLLFQLPQGYEDKTQITDLANTKNGFAYQLCLTIDNTYVQYGKRRQLICQAHDATDTIQLKFFNFYKNQLQALKNKGSKILCYGRISEFNNTKQLMHPKITYLTDYQEPECEEFLTPIYKSAGGINQALWRKMMLQALNLLPTMPLLQELVPEKILQQYTMPNLAEALTLVHRPPKDINRDLLFNKTHPCWQRLAFEELLAQHLQMERKRQEREKYSAYQLQSESKLANTLLQQLPFKLTSAQARTVKEIYHDTTQDKPMLRLVQGDVGSGKTLVAIMAILQAVESGYQAALMVPTELLAEQHLATITKYLETMGIKVGALLGKYSTATRKPILEQLANGTLQVIVGTHALFQDAVSYKNLALVVIDEQHRFGVHQRMMFWQKSNSNNKVAHQLIMTATPIPRTLAMTAYSDMDTSIIDTMPAGRKAVATTVLHNSKRDSLITKVKNLLAQGAQVYWLCTRIDSGEETISDATILHEELIQSLQPYRVGLMHGRLTPDEKTSVMQEFINSDIKVLVATTVIEVGVNVPNAQIIVIENSERLGLAQLHQLRGRVGRSDLQSYCILMYQGKLGATAKQRLETMRNNNDGFAIAEQDLQLRGAGEILGTQQSGDVSYKFADLSRDAKLCEAAYAAAQQMLNAPKKLQDALIKRWSPVSCDYQSV